LQQVDGKALPVTALTREDQNGKWEGRIESGTLQLADGNYDASFVVDVLLNGTTSFEDFVFEDRGTYRIDGNRISFQSSTVGLDRFDGTLDGDVLTVSQPVEDYGTITAVYQR